MGREGREAIGWEGQGRSSPGPGLTKGPCVLHGPSGAGWASAVGMGIWLESEALLCFLFNYDGPGSYKGSFCWGSLEEGGHRAGQSGAGGVLWGGAALRPPLSSLGREVRGHEGGDSLGGGCS